MLLVQFGSLTSRQIYLFALDYPKALINDGIVDFLRTRPRIKKQSTIRRGEGQDTSTTKGWDTACGLTTAIVNCKGEFRPLLPAEVDKHEMERSDFRIIVMENNERINETLVAAQKITRALE